MRFVGIDIGADTHFVAAGDEAEHVLIKPTKVAEDAGGYARLWELLGEPGDTLVAMVATGHYWKNLFATLVARGFIVALLNPLRTARFATEDLGRTKTDAIDALGIARFAAQKRPAATRVPDTTTEELRELVRLRDRLVQDFGDRVRQLHRLVDLGFPEFTRHVRSWTASSPRPSCTTTRRPLPSVGSPYGVWPACATTAGTAWATRLPRRSATRPRAPSDAIMARPTASRCVTPARTSISSAGDSARWRATSNACSIATRSARCSRPSTASAPDRGAPRGGAR